MKRRPVRSSGGARRRQEDPVLQPQPDASCSLTRPLCTRTSEATSRTSPSSTTTKSRAVRSSRKRPFPSRGTTTIVTSVTPDREVRARIAGTRPIRRPDRLRRRLRGRRRAEHDGQPGRGHARQHPTRIARVVMALVLSLRRPDEVGAYAGEVPGDVHDGVEPAVPQALEVAGRQGQPARHPGAPRPPSRCTTGPAPPPSTARWRCANSTSAAATPGRRRSRPARGGCGPARSARAGRRRRPRPRPR